MIGVVVGNKMDKTAVVAVERRMRHPLYRKIVRRTTKYKVHDAGNTSNLGDIVRIVETRPMSKEKRWRIAEVLTRGNVAELKPTEIGTTEVAEVSGVTAPEAPVAKVPESAQEKAPEAVVETAPAVALEKAPEAAPETAPQPAQEAAPE
jgi:small subunit ribosomal protein S17